MEINLAGRTLQLLPEKAILLPGAGILLIADLHAGKAAHFRRKGLPLPVRAVERDLERLELLVEKHRPQEVVFLGDLFHSRKNAEWDLLEEFFKLFPQTAFALVPGNHDRFTVPFCARIGLELLPPQVEKGGFLLTHEPVEMPTNGLYNLCGHLHPGVLLGGKARMSVMLPCFRFGEKYGVLPAFGNLTGLAPVPVRSGDRVVVVVEGKCVDVS